ncbi:chorion peroxidase-like [Penaeus japonicus]|uniref:chorion peroxidase-like n=1 Tax=Penaeus japonicus TaxID=27405 RepID=UPI001C70DE6B|nr:chorion peroxidase-like [Penaeus japonicus]
MASYLVVSAQIMLITMGLRGVDGAKLNPEKRSCILMPLQPRPYSRLHYFLNALDLAPFPSGSCITSQAVDAAFQSALAARGNLEEPLGDWEPEDIAPLGDILLDTSRILARRYDLSADEIWTQLPKMDVGETLVARYCPDFASPMQCVPGRYRRHDGLCNNLRFPTRGATRAAFARLVPPAYSDGLGAPRKSRIPGGVLPNPRSVSASIHRDNGYHDHAITLFVIAWGQFMDHDFTLTATPLDPLTRNEPEICCHPPPGTPKDPHCLEIGIPKDDGFYKQYGQSCLEFVRAFSGVRQDCKLGPRAPFNILAGVIDVNTVYGSTDEHARSLRLFRGGKMRMNNFFAHLGLRELLPPKLDIPEEGCTRTSPDQFCFDAGEIRVNEQLILTTMHTLWFREHNRVAGRLASLNPHWDDETLYQETRRIVIAEVQHITFNEFLPLLLGKEVMAEYGLLPEKEGYWHGYDPTEDPSMTAGFVAAAFRFGHSLLPSTVERWSPSHTMIGSKRLSKLIRQPWDLYKAGALDQYYLGLMNQPAQAMDPYITQEVTNHLFEDPGERFGMDLVSLNLQRGREFGIPGYTTYRKYCGLSPVHNFEDLARHMTNVTAYRYSQLYSHVDDIDLWSAGVSERPLPGSLLGPTFSCLVATQMQRLRRGDRYWYETPGQPSSFSLGQLDSLRRASLARVLCDNTDQLVTVQRYPMVLLDHAINPRVSCSNTINLPIVDLSPWRELPH